MTIQETIKADLKQAMLQKNTEVRDLLRVVLAEFSRVGKELTDDEAKKEITKLVKNAKELNNDGEVVILSAYLPTQMDEAELREKIQNCITFNGYSTMKDMGKVMGYMKKTHEGTYDGKSASMIVKLLLK